MTIARVIFLTLFIFSFPVLSVAQNSERISFDPGDSTGGYYIAVQPKSKQLKGVIVLLTSFTPPEDLLPETRLHNVAFNNDLLTVFVPMKGKLYADSLAVTRVNAVLINIIQRFSADTSTFVLAGYDESGNIALRYSELSYQFPGRFPLLPKAVFAIDSHVDLFGMWRWSERQIKKNYWPGAVGDARYYLDNMTKENGTIYTNAPRYRQLTPFYSQEDSTGNEQYLVKIPVRLYYDTDVEWQLKNRRNSLYDTKMPDGSELIKRLMLLGNNRAEFIQAKLPGVRSNGIRHPNALSIVDETECIAWIKRTLDIFDPVTWVPPYVLDVPAGWDRERFSLPAEFAPAMTIKGVEELRFMPGWADSTSEQYWSYGYLWWLNGTTEMNAETIQANLQTLYTGLVGRNIISRKIPLAKQVPVNVTLKQIKSLPGDAETYMGQSNMLDYMTQKPMRLNLLVHVKDCTKREHTAVFVEVSPRPLAHAVWNDLNRLVQTFRCGD